VNNQEVLTRIVDLKNGFVAWQLEITIEMAPATKADLHSRWFDFCGHKIKSVKRISVSAAYVSAKDANLSAKFIPTPAFEVEFENGSRGFVSDRGDHQELDALVVGGKGHLHGLSVWKKYRQTRGTPVSWFRAQPSARGLQNPNTAPRECAATLYSLATGEEWMALVERVGAEKTA